MAKLLVIHSRESHFFIARRSHVKIFWLDFLVLINGPEERTIPGNALSVHPDLPFRGLERFGVSFLSRFEGSQLPSSVLRSITMIDTPVRSSIYCGSVCEAFR